MKFLWSFIDLMKVEKLWQIHYLFKAFWVLQKCSSKFNAFVDNLLDFFCKKIHNFFEKIRQKILLRKMSSIQYRVKLFDILSTTATFKILPIFCEMRWVFIAKRIISCNCRETANFRFLDFINSWNLRKVLDNLLKIHSISVFFILFLLLLLLQRSTNW